jgi:hypothetical protein
LQRLGIRLEVTEAVLNHISGTRAGIAGVYQRHDWASEKRAALEAWAVHLQAVIEGRIGSGKVVTLIRAEGRIVGKARGKAAGAFRRRRAGGEGGAASDNAWAGLLHAFSDGSRARRTCGVAAGACPHVECDEVGAATI